METFEAKVTPIEYNHNQTPARKAKNKFYTIIEVIIIIALLIAIGFIGYKYYFNTDELSTIDKMITYSITDVRDYMDDESFTDEYKLVTFPDKSGVVSKDGKIINSVNLDLTEFEDGYIIMYKDNKYKFELQYDGYCMQKELDDNKYTMSIFKKCTTENVSYLITK